VSQNTTLKDLRRRKPEAALVKKEGIQLTNEARALDNAGYDEIVTMMPMIDTYRQKYVEDLANCLHINDRTLPAAYTITALCNPMFGREPKIVGSGLMTSEQFRRARDGLLKLMQTEFDRASPVEDMSNWEDEASQPRRSMLGVRNYERMALLSFILRHVFIDANWVAEEYLKRCKAGAWKKENTVDSLKCFNLERIINAVDGGAELPQDIDIEEYLASLEEATVAGVIEIDEDGNEDD
jgi:hypothetical protein